MSDYTQNVSFGPKDSLTAGDPAKKIKGTELDAELSEISTAIASKQDSSAKGSASGYASLDGSALVPVAQLPAATDAAKGAVELATTAEVVTGTDTTRAVTAAGVQAVLDQNAGALEDLASYAAPGADNILFWDHSALAITNLAVGTGLAISGTTLSCTITQVTDASQLTSGTLPNARIQASGVTQHQASLSIAESQIADGAVFPRLGAAETITGVYTFAAVPVYSGQGAFPHYASGTQSSGAITVSASDASGTPAAGDLWIKYTA